MNISVNSVRKYTRGPEEQSPGAVLPVYRTFSSRGPNILVESSNYIIAGPRIFPQLHLHAKCFSEGRAAPHTINPKVKFPNPNLDGKNESPVLALISV